MVPVDLKLLRSLATVAADGSVTRAAERLNLSQPTISGHIRELERQLGFPLFHRTTRRLESSAEARRLLPFVDAVLRDADSLALEIAAMQRTAVSGFRLGASVFSLQFEDRTELLEAFAAALPDLRHSIDNRLQSAQVQDLLGGRLDAAIFLGVAAAEDFAERYRGALKTGSIVNEIVYPDSLERVVLRRRPVRLLIPADSVLAERPVIPRAALAGLPVAMLSLEHGEAVIDPIARFLAEAGALPVQVTEGNALAVERYAARRRMAAMSIGWFAPPADMVVRGVEGMSFHTELVVLLGTAPSRAARRFFAFAASWASSRGPIPSDS